MSKLKSMAALAALGASLGYGQVASLRALVADDSPSVVFEPSLVGKWSWGVEIARDGKNGYKVGIGDTKLTMRLVRLSGILLGDVFSGPEGGLPCHFFVKLDIQADQFHVSFLNSEWLAQEIQTRGWPRHEVLTEGDQKGGVLLTASSEELRRDLLAYLDDPRAWKDDEDLERVK